MYLFFLNFDGHCQRNLYHCLKQTIFFLSFDRNLTQKKTTKKQQLTSYHSTSVCHLFGQIFRFQVVLYTSQLCVEFYGFLIETNNIITLRSVIFRSKVRLLKTTVSNNPYLIIISSTFSSQSMILDFIF